MDNIFGQQGQDPMQLYNTFRPIAKEDAVMVEAMTNTPYNMPSLGDYGRMNVDANMYLAPKTGSPFDAINQTVLQQRYAKDSQAAEAEKARYLQDVGIAKVEGANRTKENKQREDLEVSKYLIEWKNATDPATKDAIAQKVMALSPSSASLIFREPKDNYARTATMSPLLLANIQKSVAPYRKGIDAAEKARSLLIGARQGDGQAMAGIHRLLLETFGEGGNISTADIKGVGVDPALIGSVMDMLNKGITGVPTEDTLRQIDSAINAVDAINRTRHTTVLEAQRKYGNALQLPPDVVDAAISAETLAPAGPSTMPKKNASPVVKTTKSGLTYTVE